MSPAQARHEGVDIASRGRNGRPTRKGAGLQPIRTTRFSCCRKVSSCVAMSAMSRNGAPGSPHFLAPVASCRRAGALPTPTAPATRSPVLRACLPASLPPPAARPPAAPRTCTPPGPGPSSSTAGATRPACARPPPPPGPQRANGGDHDAAAAAAAEEETDDDAEAGEDGNNADDDDGAVDDRRAFRKRRAPKRRPRARARGKDLCIHSTGGLRPRRRGRDLPGKIVYDP
eukprot:scaffold3068_cov401-Prasinococcus_capsulatus_cf.AAC.57